MARILFCYPLPSTTSPQKNPALSIFYPGAAAEKKGHDVYYWDQRYDSNQDLVDKVAKVDYVGVSSKTGEQIIGAVKILKYAKENSKTTIFGGIHPSLLPSQSIAESYIDYVIVGEGEKTIVELMGALESRKEPGLGVMSREGFKGNQVQLKGSEIPSPITDKTLPYFERSYPMDVMLPSSRGCPYGCGFCYNVSFHQSKYRPIPLDAWARDIDRLPGIQWFQMGEDWVGPKNRIIEIAEILNERRIGWSPSLRADQIDEELAHELSRRGCTGVSIGIESGSPKVLADIVDKRETIEDYLKSARILSQNKLKPQYYFILGFPGESKKDRELTYDFADELYRIHKGNITMVFYSFTSLPGTPLFDKAVQIGMKIPHNLMEWSVYSLNKSSSKELSNIYHIAGLNFHRGKKDKTDRNFPGMKRWLIRPFETLCLLRWKLRFFGFFGFENICIETLMRWRAANKA